MYFAPLSALNSVLTLHRGETLLLALVPKYSSHWVLPPGEFHTNCCAVAVVPSFTFVTFSSHLLVDGKAEADRADTEKMLAIMVRLNTIDKMLFFFFFFPPSIKCLLIVCVLYCCLV